MVDPGADKLRLAVVMAAAGNPPYFHLAVTLVQNVRQVSSFRDDIVAFLEMGKVACVESHLRRLGVQLHDFSELWAGVPFQLTRWHPAWHKVGVIWHAVLRRYHRIFFLDTDQFLDADVSLIMRRRLPEGVAIAMCAKACARNSLALQNESGHSGPCGWRCMDENSRFDPARRQPVDSHCDSFDDLQRSRVEGNSTNGRNFRARFPRKSFPYISGVFLLDLTRLPPPAETRSLALRLLLDFEFAWLSFGDQGWFTTFFYDAAAILPECGVHPPAWRHIFHTAVADVVRPKVVRAPDLSPPPPPSLQREFARRYSNVTGSEAVCDLAPRPSDSRHSGFWHFVEKARKYVVTATKGASGEQRTPTGSGRLS